jgi:hypothetical protein
LERFLFSDSLELLQLFFDEFPVVTEDDFISLCSIGGTVKLSVVIPDDDDTSIDNPNNKQNDEAIIDNVTDDLDPDADNTAFQENVRDAETSLKVKLINKCTCKIYKTVYKCIYIYIIMCMYI